MEEPKKILKKRNKKVLTLFILMMPSLLLAMCSAIPTSAAIFNIRLGFQIVLLFLQFVLVKSMLDDYFGEDEV